MTTKNPVNNLVAMSVMILAIHFHERLQFGNEETTNKLEHWVNDVLDLLSQESGLSLTKVREMYDDALAMCFGVL